MFFYWKVWRGTECRPQRIPNQPCPLSKVGSRQSCEDLSAQNFMTFTYLNQPASILGSTIHWRPMLQCSQPRKHFTRWIFQTIPMDFKKLHWKALAVDELTQACFHPDNQMVKCNPRNGKSIKLKTSFLTLGGKKVKETAIWPSSFFHCRQVHGRLFTLPRRCRAKGCERGNNGDQDGKGCGLCQLVPDRVQGFENCF